MGIMVIMDFMQNNPKIWFINLFGLMLLFLKLVGVSLSIGYFLIVCIIFWQITIVTLIVGVILLGLIVAGIIVWFDDRRK